MKKLAKNLVAAVLGYQVRKLSKKNDLKIVAVVGSIGKTSTKLAIAQVLSTGFRVRYQDGNYNDLVSVPLVFFGEPIPSLFNPVAWLALFCRNQKQIKQNYPYEVVVLELGSDGPGQIERFKQYLKLEIAVISAISPEHMEFFADLDAVAKEELSVANFSSLILANKDLCDKKYLSGQPNLLTYSLESADFDSSLYQIDISLTKAEQYSCLAAAAVASKLGMSADQIKSGIKKVRPPAGRMQKLKGINGSTIIDDSYNSSPAAAKLALDALYDMKSPQKIAVLGNMNEMGKYTQAAHQEIGSYCDPKQLALVATIGPEANQFLAPSASQNGCEVKTFNSPYEAGEYIKPLVKSGAVILVKGSQNKVFAEETVKILLASPSDASKLVRQSEYWTNIKSRSFKK